MPRRRKRRRGGQGRVVLAALVILGLPLLGWAAANALSGDDSGGDPAASADGSRTDGVDPASRGGSPETPAAEGSYEDAQAAREAVGACAARLEAGEAYVQSAGVGIGHWGEHVQARTDMLNGTVVEEEMRAIWKRTRLSGPADVTQATAALEAYEALPACEGISDLGAPESVADGVADQAEACLARETTTTAAVTAATAGLQDWANHLNAMAAHADGEMTASAAQDLWVAAWEAAPTNINAYNDARDQLVAAPACE